MKGKQAAEMISQMVNTNNTEELNEFIETLRKDHRFLQGQEIMFLLKLMKMFSEVGTDARNEREVNFMKKVVAYVENEIGKLDSKY
jgi:hypothetical protein